MKNYEDYYKIASQGSLDIETPVMKKLIKFSRNQKKILDIGCGEGTRLSIIAKNKNGYGVDNNSYATEQGKKTYPHLKLIKGDIENLPFKNEEFDFVYSAFVLEHLNNPEKVLREADRVLKRDGVLLLVCPNYGAPNRRSPCNFENKYLKIVSGVLADIRQLFLDTRNLNWKQVKPRLSEPFQIDFDTEVEPYLYSLMKFLKSIGFIVLEESSFWEIKEDNNTLIYKLIKKLGQLNIFPFKYWGPQIYITAKKV